MSRNREKSQILSNVSEELFVELYDDIQGVFVTSGELATVIKLKNILNKWEYVKLYKLLKEKSEKR